MALPIPHLDRVLERVYGRSVSGALSPLKIEASGRRYHRFRLENVGGQGGPASVAVMCLPDAPDMKEAGIAQAHAFVDVQRYLTEQGIRVPRVYAVDIEAGLLVLEDLGDETFEARLRKHASAEWPALYAHAVDRLAELHTRCEPPKPADACIAYRRRFDATLLRSELDHFLQWGLLALSPELPDAARARFDAIFDQLTQRIVSLREGLVHRDYQSRNLMWTRRDAAGDQDADQLVIIDFQDAFLGPAHYDLVALLCDSYVDIDAELQQAMLDRYAARRVYSAAERAQLSVDFALLTVQRKLKDAGRFVFIDRVRKNPGFLHHYPQSLRYVEGALSSLTSLPEIAELRALLVRHIPGFPDAVATPAAISGS